MKEIVKTERAPRAIGPYSQGIKTNNLIFTAGQLGIGPSTGEIVQGGIGAETERVLLNITAILEAAGSSLDKVVKTAVFLSDLTDFPEMNMVYQRFFADSFPARSTVQGKLLKGAKVEIEAIAMVD